MPPRIKNKPVFKTAVPYTGASWPEISTADQENILDLLCGTSLVLTTPSPCHRIRCSLLPNGGHKRVSSDNPSVLQPLGDHRRTHIAPSKGRKRKRKTPPQPPDSNTPTTEDQSDTAKNENPQPPPEIGSHILVGLNSVTRHLEALAARHAPPSLADLSRQRTTAAADPKKADVPTKERENRMRTARTTDEVPAAKTLHPKNDASLLTIVIIPHAHPCTSLPHAHIPTLTHLANLFPSITSSSTILPSSTDTSTRLVTLPPSTEARLASALHIPHVGAIAIKEGAPGTSMLVEYVRTHVGLTRCVWIDEAISAQWIPTRIDVGR